jgi:6,7-dimethyl-8-ribityllumazine synthase
MRTPEPSPPMRLAVVVSRFNKEIVDGLLEGAFQELAEAGMARDSVPVIEVPGALELPVVAAELARQGRYEGLIALGCVIRGETSHHEHVGRESVGGLVRVAVETGVAIGIGVLTVDSPAQARVRAGLDPDPGSAKEGRRHRGREAARACLETAALLRELRAGRL